MTKEVEALSWRAFERSSEQVTKKEKFAVDLASGLICIRSNFNPRDMQKPATIEKIQRIKQSFINGKFVPPIICDWVNGKLEIVDGECRYTAAMLADKELKEQGSPGIKEIIVDLFKGNEADKIVMTIQANEGEKLLPIEICEQVKRLTGQGWDSAKIESILSYSRQWIAQLLCMANLPERMKQMIRLDQVSADVGMTMYKKHGEDSVAILEKMIADKSSRITKKDMPKRENPAFVAYRHAKIVFESMPTVSADLGIANDDDTVTVTMSAKAARALMQMQPAKE